MDDRRYAGLPPPADPERLAAQLDGLYRERLRLFAARRLGNTSDADDVAQEALRRALEALKDGRVESLSGIPGFLFQAARFICMQRFRSAQREHRALRTLAASSTGSSLNPLLDLIREERKHEVLVALSRLDRSDQELLRMSFGQELSTAEIGRRLGLNAGAVRVRRFRAIRRLSEILGVTREPDREGRE